MTDGIIIRPKRWRVAVLRKALCGYEYPLPGGSIQEDEHDLWWGRAIWFLLGVGAAVVAMWR